MQGRDVQCLLKLNHERKSACLPVAAVFLNDSCFKIALKIIPHGVMCNFFAIFFCYFIGQSFMRHVPEFPCGKLTKNVIYFIQKFLDSIRINRKIKINRTWNRTSFVIFKCMINIRNNRAVFPCKNLFLKQRRAGRGKIKPLSKIKKFLQFQIRNQVSRFVILKSKKVVGYLSCCHHKRTVSAKKYKINEFEGVWKKWTPTSDKVERRRCHYERDSAWPVSRRSFGRRL